MCIIFLWFLTDTYKYRAFYKMQSMSETFYALWLGLDNVDNSSAIHRALSTAKVIASRYHSMELTIDL